MPRMGFAQAASVTVVPESGFISTDRYTNAFFGFSFPLPQDSAFSEYRLPINTKTHALYGTKAQAKHGLGITVLVVVADQINGVPAEQARLAAFGDKAKKVRKTQLAGKEFWTGESEENGAGGKMRSIIYAASIDGYVLKFHIISFDGKLSRELERCIREIQFFDPTEAQKMAGPHSRSYNPLLLRNPN